MDNAWGILRCVVDFFMKMPEGKYLMLKDPNKVCRCICKLYLWFYYLITFLLYFLLKHTFDSPNILLERETISSVFDQERNNVL